MDLILPKNCINGGIPSSKYTSGIQMNDTMITTNPIVSPKMAPQIKMDLAVIIGDSNTCI